MPPPLRSRTTVYRWAWILFGVGVLLPAPGCLYSGFWGNTSGLSAIGYAVEWGRTVPDPIDARHGIGVLVLAVGFLSNLVFLASRSVGEEDVSRGFRLVLLGSLAANVSLAFLHPPLARIPGYWIWLAGWAALAWALLGIRGTLHAKAAEGGAGVPALLWAWLAFLVFWAGVTVVNRVSPLPPAAEPSAPEPAALTGYVTDPGRLLLPGEKERFERLLSAFDRETSCQVAVALYRRVPSGSVEDFTLRTASGSRLGQRGLDNGAVLFVFAGERVARLEVGYGLEGALPDVTAFHVLERDLAPRLEKGEVAAGVDASLSAILAAVGGEFGPTRAPGFAKVAWRQVAVAARRVRREAWPALRRTDAGARVGISLFGGLLGMGVSTGIASAGRLARALVLGLWNVAHGRPFRLSLEGIDLSSIWDTVKLAAFLAIVVGGTVLVAGGGGFGGAGALLKW